MFGKYDRLEVKVKIGKLEIEGLTAKVQSKIKMSGIQGEQKTRLFGTLFLARDLLIYFEKRRGTWVIVGSELVQRALM